MSTGPLAGAVLAIAAAAYGQSLSDLATPVPVPPNSIVVVGFLGGWDRWDDPGRAVRRVALNIRERRLPNVFAETFANRRRGAALRFLRHALDTDRDGRIGPAEAKSSRVVLYGQSLGASAAIRTARDLAKLGVEVLETVQIDSVGLFDEVIPPNVRTAVNLYQREPFTIRGLASIRAEDPARTRILGNLLFEYRDLPRLVETSWRRRALGRGHSQMELDPAVRALVETLILDAIAKS